MKHKAVPQDERRTTGDWKDGKRKGVKWYAAANESDYGATAFHLTLLLYDELRWALLPFVSFISSTTWRNRLSRISTIGFVCISVRRYLVSRKKKKAFLLLRRIRNFVIDKQLIFSVINQRISWIRALAREKYKLQKKNKRIWFYIIICIWIIMSRDFSPKSSLILSYQINKIFNKDFQEIRRVACEFYDRAFTFFTLRHWILRNGFLRSGRYNRVKRRTSHWSERAIIIFATSPRLFAIAQFLPLV